MLGSSFVFVIEGFQVGGGGCVNDSGKASLHRLFRQRSAVTASCIIAKMRGVAATSTAAAMSRALW